VRRATAAIEAQAAPFQASLPWWQEAQDLVTWVRDHHDVDVIILRLLEASLPAPPGGRVTYLAEVDGAQAGGLSLSGWPGVLEPHPLRLPYAEPGGPSRELSSGAAAEAEAEAEADGSILGSIHAEEGAEMQSAPGNPGADVGSGGRI